MKANPVGWFEIYVQDLERAQKFYEAVFDGKLEAIESPDPNFSMLSFPMDDGLGSPGAIVKCEGVDPGNNSTMVYFSCVDCAVEGSRVESAGGKVVREKMAIGQYGFVVLANDSEGNMIGLHSRQ